MTSTQTTTHTIVKSRIRLASRSASLLCGSRADCQPRASQPAQASSRTKRSEETGRLSPQRLGGGTSAPAGPRFSAGRDCISSFRLGAAVRGAYMPIVCT